MRRYKILTKEQIEREGRDMMLSGRKLQDFVKFIKKRFPKEIDARYVSEWAIRFQNGSEWNRSDYESRRVLLSINKKKYSDLDKVV